ncbi:phage tail tape measure protein [Paenibacillus ottowii]|uniref:Phage tail tape measure protein n=1 Tax=Paenibacillus ottowii TaxID=2315729 RepID=A0ABY3BAJ1_9BACL|nr:phage tail tape measure protein [Paenibacillus ottowii]TQS01375.1 phage tail tape measure protein [Paenibacillus ottowii]TQS01430.1 phage tail tape measure protein [Paenibacillus ottowii]
MAGGVIGNLMFAVGFKVAEGPLRRAEDQLSSLRGGVFAFGAAATAAMGAFAVASISAASNFEKNMAQVQMATGQTDQQMLATKEIAKNLYSQNFGENWQDLSGAISTTAQITGQTGAALEGTTKNAMLLGRAFNFEVGESVRTTDTMMRQFGITSEQSMTLLAQGAQKGLDKTGELLDTANEYSVSFKSLGFGADDMFDTLAAGSQNGAFNLDKVGDAVKEFNIRAKDGSKTTTQAFEMLGLNADKMMHTFAQGGPEAKKSFQQVMQMIGDIEDPVQRNTVGVALMGSQFEDLEAKTITAMGSVKSQFNSAADTLNDINKVRFNSPGEALQMFGRQIETGILIPVGQKLLPYLNRFGQWAADHKPQIEAFGAAIGDKIGKAIEWLTTKAQELWPTLQSVGSTIAGVVQKMTSFEGFAPRIAGIAAALVAYKAVVTTISVATRIWTAFQLALNVAMSLNPIGLVVALIAGLVVAFVVAYKKSEKFRNIINGAWAGIKIAFAATMNFFTTTVPNVFNAIVNFIVQWGPTFLISLTGPIGWAVAAVVKYWDEIKAFTILTFMTIQMWLVTLWTGITGSISGAVSSIWSRITNAWNNVKTTTSNIFNGVKSFLSNVWNSILSTISTTVTNIWNKITGIWNQIISYLQGINLFEVGKNIIEGMINGIMSMANAVVDKVKGIGDSIQNSIKSALDIHSPSRVMMELGFFTGEGLARGIEGTQDRVAAAATGMTDEIIPSTNSPTNAPARKLAPARVGGGGSAGGAMNISVNIDLRADASSATVAGDVAAEVRRQVQKILEETFRREGFVSPEVNM